MQVGTVMNKDGLPRGKLEVGSPKAASAGAGLSGTRITLGPLSSSRPSNNAPGWEGERMQAGIILP